MRRLTRPLLTTFFSASFMCAVPVNAQLDSNYYVPDIETTQTLSEEGLLSVFSGKTHLGTYSFLRDDISTYAFTETTFSDGRVRHVQNTYEKEIVDTGAWEVDDDRICYDYDNPRLTQACFKIYLVGNCYYHYQVETQGRDAFGFTARSVIKGERPNCEPAIS